MNRELTWTGQRKKGLSPFMSYYGSKARSAWRYPQPIYDTIIEPFAGGAGYSLLHYEKDVVLIERDPRLVCIWRFLIGASAEEILGLPLLGLNQTVFDLPSCSLGGRELIRSWLQGGSRNGKNSFSSMAKNNLLQNPNTPKFWGEACRARIAAQVDKIKHWKVIDGDYKQAPDKEATWFIDPPYNNAAGRVYTFHKIDYPSLGIWCRDRRGQVCVCENEGATWLPFRPLYSTKNNWNRVKETAEVLWSQDKECFPDDA